MSNPDFADPRMPLIVLTGFLGAGKTTLLNRYLKSPKGAGTAVLVNEFGSLPIDADLIEAQDGDLTVLAGGFLVLSQETVVLGIKMCDRPLTVGAMITFYAMWIG